MLRPDSGRVREGHRGSKSTLQGTSGPVCPALEVVLDHLQILNYETPQRRLRILKVKALAVTRTRPSLPGPSDLIVANECYSVITMKYHRLRIASVRWDPEG